MKKILIAAACAVGLAVVGYAVIAAMASDGDTDDLFDTSGDKSTAGVDLSKGAGPASDGEPAE